MHAVTQAGEAWDYPQPFDNISPDDMRWMREEVRHQKYRYDPRSPDWVGLALAQHLGLDPRADRKTLNAILRALSLFIRRSARPLSERQRDAHCGFAYFVGEHAILDRARQHHSANA